MPDDRDMRAISTCWQGGWHAYMAGPCFDRYDQAVVYRDKLDKHGITFKSQDEPWPLIPNKES